MSGWRYAWLLVVCAVIAPLTGGLLLAIPFIAANTQTSADIPAGFALFGGFGLVSGALPGLASGLILAFLRHRRGRLSLPMVIAVVVSCVAAFAAVLEFHALGAEHTIQGFLGNLAVMAVPALLAVIAIWFLRGRMGLGTLG